MRLLMSDEMKLELFEFARRFDITQDLCIEHRVSFEGSDLDIWVILMKDREIYNKNRNMWEVVRLPSSRTDAFFARTRFTLKEAWETIHSARFQRSLSRFKEIGYDVDF